MVRRRFVRRFVVIAALFLIFVIVTSVLTYHGFGAPRRRFVPFWLLIPLVIGGIALVRAVRGFARPMGDVMEAADRVALGDYSVRVEERGPGEVRRLGRAFNQMTERLGSSEERRRTLLADVTHELRTPLAVVQANVEGLIDGVYPTDREHLVLILEEARMMSHLLDDLQTLSTAEAGALRLHLERAAAADVVEDAVEAFRVAASDAGVSLTNHVVDGLPALSVDRLRIAEVFTNLVSNALRHTPRGGSITVDAMGDEHRVEFSVTDTGSGIPADQLPTVFDRFAKAPGSRGVGLGLAIAKSLVVAHGGEIGVESPPTGGTRVYFALPGVSD
jgi:two-component system, OmpR family, sensor histidine kinase BaeS